MGKTTIYFIISVLFIFALISCSCSIKETSKKVTSEIIEGIGEAAKDFTNTVKKGLNPSFAPQKIFFVLR